MKRYVPHGSLLAKTFGWLCLHLFVLALLFAGFVSWQLGMGLDSLLSGAAGERIARFGDEVRTHLIEVPVDDWPAEVEKLAAGRGLRAWLVTPRITAEIPAEMPENVRRRVREAMPPIPPAGRRGQAPHGLGGRGEPREERSGRPAEGPGSEWVPREIPKTRPMFLMRGDQGDGYWAGVLMPMNFEREGGRRPALLVLRSGSLDGGGMFFDLKPWLWGGLAVLGVTWIFWLPVVLRISRYIRQLTLAAESISAGNFQISLPQHAHDELGNLGRGIESMAARLDLLVSGQKRFLGDAAHELCAPLARIRTGLAILETRLPESALPQWESLDADAAELAGLVQEILRFSKTGRQSPVPARVDLVPLLRSLVGREGGELQIQWDLHEPLVAWVDEAMISRAMGNIIRNASIHAGAGATLQIRGNGVGERLELVFSDNGPGVAEVELPRLFEPFYRTDPSRCRETGGFGLGLAIVRTSVEACGGSVRATSSPSGGLEIALNLQR